MNEIKTNLNAGQCEARAPSSVEQLIHARLQIMGINVSGLVRTLSESNRRVLSENDDLRKALADARLQIDALCVANRKLADQVCDPTKPDPRANPVNLEACDKADMEAPKTPMEVGITVVVKGMLSDDDKEFLSDFCTFINSH